MAKHRAAGDGREAALPPEKPATIRTIVQQRPWLLLLVPGIVLAVVAALTVQIASAPKPAAAPPVEKMFFGTLTSDPGRSADEAAAGVGVAMLELSWREYEPERGKWNQTYIRQQQERLRALLDSNRRVTLALGLHYTPGWALGLPGGRFVDERNTTSDDLNVVFSQPVRDQVATYLEHVAGDLDLANFWSVRLTSGGSAELLYPDGDGYWAFDENALGDGALPPTLRPNPLPDWRPGDTGASADELATWVDWYVGGLADVATWQMATLSDLGFRGSYEMLTPGTGVQPRQRREAIDNHLPRGLLGVGAVWDRFYAGLPRDRNIVAYISSMADTSGGDDSCTANDLQVAPGDPAVENWSAARWISRVADQYGFPKRGENPGYNAPPALNGHYTDASDSGMMVAAVRQAQDCGLQGLYWAHDEQFWDGTVDFTRFADLAREVNGAPAGREQEPN